MVIKKENCPGYSRFLQKNHYSHLPYSTRIDNYINMNKNTSTTSHDHKELTVILDYVDFWFNNIS